MIEQMILENQAPPKVSVITVVKNDVDNIRRTIESVVHQTYPNIEYLVVDGNSNDGTKGIIEEYTDQIDVYISESDDGIYHAMNKGILNSNGDWIGILNSGDEYIDNNTIKKVFSEVNPYPL